MNIPLFKVCGDSDTGKTTLVETIVEELKNRNYRLGVIKHDPADHWEWDVKGTDTERHARAGADGVAILSPGRFGLYQKRDGELDLQQLVEKFDPRPDLVLLEGFRSLDVPGFTQEEGQWVDQQGNTYNDENFSGMIDAVENQIKSSRENKDLSCRLEVDGKPVDLTSFPRRALVELLWGFVRSLSGVDRGTTLTVEIEDRRPSD